MAARIEMICVHYCLALAALFTAVSGEDVLVIIIIEMFVFIEMLFRHCVLRINFDGLLTKWFLRKKIFPVSLSNFFSGPFVSAFMCSLQSALFICFLRMSLSINNNEISFS